MLTSTLFSLIDLAYLTPLRKRIEQKNGEDKWVNMYENDLSENLTEKQKDALKHYKVSIINQMDELHDELGINVLNLGIQICMELQEAFSKLDV